MQSPWSSSLKVQGPDQVQTSVARIGTAIPIMAQQAHDRQSGGPCQTIIVAWYSLQTRQAAPHRPWAWHSDTAVYNIQRILYISMYLTRCCHLTAIRVQLYIQGMYRLHDMQRYSYSTYGAGPGWRPACQRCPEPSCQPLPVAGITTIRVRIPYIDR